MIQIGKLYAFHSTTEPTEVPVPPDGTIVKVLHETEAFDPALKMYECAAEGDDKTFPAFEDELHDVV